MFYPLFVSVLERVYRDSMRKSLFMENIANLCGGKKYQLIEQADLLTEELLADDRTITIANVRKVALIALKVVGVSDYKIVIACLIHKNVDYAKKHNLRSWNSEFIDKWFGGVRPLLIDSCSESPSEYGGAVVKLSIQLHKLIMLVRTSAKKDIRAIIKKEMGEIKRDCIIAKKYKILEDELVILINHLEYYLRL